MKTSYVVSSGSYSGYRVHAVFESEEDAKAHAAQIGSWADVVDMPYFPTGTRPEMTTIWDVTAQGPDFELDLRARTEPEYDGETAMLRGRRPKVDENTRWVRNGSEKVPFLSCRSLDLEAAKKVVSDRAAQLKAKAAGIA